MHARWPKAPLRQTKEFRRLQDRVRHTTIALQTDQEPATLALVAAIVRGSPSYSSQCAGLVEGSNGLATELLRAYRKCRQRFEQIQMDLLAEKLKEAPALVEESEATLIAPAASSQDVDMGGQAAQAQRPGEAMDDAMPTERRALEPDAMDAEEEGAAKKPKVATIGALRVCELAVCEERFDEGYDPAWDPVPRRSARCAERCDSHHSWCYMREGQLQGDQEKERNS